MDTGLTVYEIIEPYTDSENDVATNLYNAGIDYKMIGFTSKDILATKYIARLTDEDRLLISLTFPDVTVKQYNGSKKVST